MSIEHRKALAPYEGQRVRVVGYYSVAGVGHPAHIKRACVEDCLVTTPDGKQFHIGHTWVQRANAIVNQKPLKGAKLRFSAVVSSYDHRLTVPNLVGVMKETAWGLTHPEDVEVSGTDELDFCATAVKSSPQSGQQLPTPQPVPDVVRVVQSLKELTTKIEPAVLRTAVEHLSEITDTVATCGGPDPTLRLLAVVLG
jgi:hypothetical protein